MASVDPQVASPAYALRWARWVDKRRRPIVLIAAALALVSAFLASRLPVEGDFSYLLPPNEKSVQDLHALEKRTQSLSTFMIGVESDDPVKREKTAAALYERLKKVDKSLIAQITYDERAPRMYAWNNRFLFAPLDDLQTALSFAKKKVAESNPLYVPLDEDEAKAASQESQKEEKSALDDLRARLDKLKKEAEANSIQVSKDSRLQMVLVRSSGSSQEIDAGRKLLRILEEINAQIQAEAGPGVVIGMAGDVITTEAEQKALLQGMLVSTLVTVVLVLLALLAFYRSAAAVAGLLGSLAVGALLTFGYARLSIGHLNLASAFLSSIVIGNGINFGIILLARYLEERRKGRIGDEAIAVAIGGTVPGTLAAALTAAVAYGSLAVTDFRGFRDFGIIGGVGMVLCWISAYTVFPALIASLDRRGKIDVKPELPVNAVLSRIIPNQPRLIAYVAVALLLVLSAATIRFLTTDPFESNLNNLRSQSSEIAASSKWMQKFDRAFGSGISAGFVIAVPRRDVASVVADKQCKADEGN